MVRVNKDEILRGYGSLEPGMEILATKWIALLGTAYLAKIYKRQLRKHFSASFINQATALARESDVVSALMAAVGFSVAADEEVNAVTSAGVDSKTAAILDISVGPETVCEVCEGGIYAALWQMADKSGVGLEIQLRQIPIRQETVEICEFLDANPYQMLSGGCLLIGTHNADEVLRRLEKSGICAVRIGRATGGNDRVLLDEEQVRYIERPQPDTFCKVLEQRPVKMLNKGIKSESPE